MNITLGGLSYNAYVNAFDAFVQDSISLGSKVKLDLGLRYDSLPSPTEGDDKLVTFDPASSSLIRIGSNGFTQVTKNGSDFQPRVGVIWNPTGEGKLAVRGAYAVMVNQRNTGLPVVHERHRVRSARGRPVHVVHAAAVPVLGGRRRALRQPFE